MICTVPSCYHTITKTDLPFLPWIPLAPVTNKCLSLFLTIYQQFYVWLVLFLCLKKAFPTLRSWSYCYITFSKAYSFAINIYIFIYPELLLWMAGDKGSSFIFSFGYPIVPGSFIKNSVFFQLICWSHLSYKYSQMCGFISGLYVLLH